MFGGPPNAKAIEELSVRRFGQGNRRNIRSTVEERRFQRRVKLPNPRGLQPPWSHFVLQRVRREIDFAISIFRMAWRAKKALGEAKISTKRKD
jgi:hypothetical protein